MCAKRSYEEMNASKADDSSSDDCLPDLVPCDSSESGEAKKMKFEEDELYDPEDTLSTVSVSDIESSWWSDDNDGEVQGGQAKVVPVADHGFRFSDNDCKFCQQVFAANAAVHVHADVHNAPIPSTSHDETPQLMDLSKIKKEPVDDDGEEVHQQAAPDVAEDDGTDEPAAPSNDVNAYDSDDVQIVGYIPPADQRDSVSSVIEILDSSFSDDSTVAYDDDAFYQNQLDDPEVHYLYQQILSGEWMFHRCTTKI